MDGSEEEAIQPDDEGRDGESESVAHVLETEEEEVVGAAAMVVRGTVGTLLVKYLS